MKKNFISIYLRNKNINASGYYRITQYIEKIDNIECRYRELVPDKQYINYHFNKSIFGKVLYIINIYFRGLFFLIVDNIFIPKIVIINREICPKKIFILRFLLERRLCKRTMIIWDFDDCINNGEISTKEWKLLEKRANNIIVTNHYLKSLINSNYKEKVSILATTDGDFKYSNDLINNRKNSYTETIRILWIATSSSIPFLIPILRSIDDFANFLYLKNKKKVILTCVCNKKIEFKSHHFILNNILWSREKALLELSKSHIGIMPLEKNSFTIGKGGFKIIQYMAAGIPVVASNVGMNSEIIDDNIGYLVNNSEWSNYLLRLSENVELWEKKSISARKKWELNYSFETNLIFWRCLLSHDKSISN